MDGIGIETPDAPEGFEPLLLIDAMLGNEDTLPEWIEALKLLASWTWCHDTTTSCEQIAHLSISGSRVPVRPLEERSWNEKAPASTML